MKLPTSYKKKLPITYQQRTEPVTTPKSISFTPESISTAAYKFNTKRNKQRALAQKIATYTSQPYYKKGGRKKNKNGFALETQGKKDQKQQFNKGLRDSKLHDKNKRHFTQRARTAQIAKTKIKIRRTLRQAVRTKIKTFLIWSGRALTAAAKKKSFYSLQLRRKALKKKAFFITRRKRILRGKRRTAVKKRIFLLQGKFINRTDKCRTSKKIKALRALLTLKRSKKKIVRSLPVTNRKNEPKIKLLSKRVVKKKKSNPLYTNKKKYLRLVVKRKKMARRKVNLFHQRNLLRGFVSTLKNYANNGGKTETQAWKNAQKLQLAEWLVVNTQRRGVKKTNLLENLYKRTHKLKRSASPEERRTLAIIRKVESLPLHASAKSDKTARFAYVLKSTRKRLSKLIGLRKGKKQARKKSKLTEGEKRKLRVRFWKLRLKIKNKRRTLRKILQPLIKNKFIRAEKRIAKVIWLFLSPDVTARRPTRPKEIRPVEKNRLRNRWRKTLRNPASEKDQKKKITALSLFMELIVEGKEDRVAFEAEVANANTQEKLLVKRRPVLVGKLKPTCRRKWLGYRPRWRKLRRKVFKRGVKHILTTIPKKLLRKRAIRLAKQIKPAQNIKKSRKKMKGTARNTTKKLAQLETKLFTNISLNNALFRTFSTGAVKITKASQQPKKASKLRRVKWAHLIARNVRNLRKSKVVQAAHVTKKRFSFPVLSKVKTMHEENRKTGSILRSRRINKKLKKLEKGRQTAVLQRKKPLVRKFITARILIANSRKPTLSTVRKAAKKDALKNNLTGTRSTIKRGFTLYRAQNNKNKTSNFASTSISAEATHRNFLKLEAVAKEQKFFQRWRQLLRNSRSKKRAWRKLLNKGWKVVKRSEHRRFLGVQKSKKQPRLKIKQLRKRFSKASRQKNRAKQQSFLRLKLHTSRTNHSWKENKLTRNKRQLALKKLQGNSSKALFGGKLKCLRRAKKQLLRQVAKKSINRRRKRWFKKAVSRALKRKRPVHLKPWEQKPSNPLVESWAKAAYKKTKLWNSKKARLSKKKKNNDKSHWLRKCLASRQIKSAVKMHEHALSMLPLLSDTRQAAEKLKTLVPVQRQINKIKKLVGRAPYLTPYYRIKARLQNKRNRKGVSKQERVARKARNFRNAQAARKIQDARKRINAKHKRELKPIKSLAIVTRAEKKKRRIAGTKRKKRKGVAKNRLVGRPSAIGVTRTRRVFATVSGPVKNELLHRTARQLWKEKIKNEIAIQAVISLQRTQLKLKITKPVEGGAIKKIGTCAAKKATPTYIKTRKTKKVKASSARLRNPGVGRVKNTFESTLRKQYKQRLPLFYRERNKKITKTAQMLHSKQLSRPDKIEAVTRLQKSSAQLNKASKQQYQSSEARLTDQQKKHETGKFGFAKTAAKILKRLVFFRARQEKRNAANSNDEVNKALLQVALYRKRATRKARDLRKLARRYKIARIKTRPFWMKRRHMKKLYRARAAKLYPIAEDARYTRPNMNKWAVNELAIGASWKRAWVAQKKTLAGESMKATTQIRRIAAITYLQKGLKKKKRRLERKRNKLQSKKILRLKKRKAHNATRGVKNIFSRFRRHKRRKLRKLKIWSLKKRYRVEGTSRYRLKKRLKYNKALRQLSINAISNLLIRTAEEKEKLEKLVQEAAEPTILVTPLHFKKATEQLTASTEENKKWRQHVQAIQKQKYGRLEEVSNAITTIMPNIISLFLKNKAALTRSQAKRAVTAAYWNLRLMIQQAYRSNKFNPVDVNPTRRARLKQELAVRAANRFFDTNAVRKTRYRFQPHRLIAAPSLKRGAEDWIRQYLPKFYDLFLEDAEKYGHLMITPIKIFRAHPNCAAIEKWETRTNPSTIEAQFKRLTKGTRGRSSSRFENMLITAKRSPTINGKGQKANALTLTGTSAQKWQSFFKRGYSTYVQRHALAFKKVTSLTKYAAKEECSTPATLLKTYKSIKSRNVAKNKKKHISDYKTETGGALDIRLVRQKSPRSSEYIKRLLSNTEQQHEKTLLTYKTFLQQNKKAIQMVGRDSRQRTSEANRRSSFLSQLREKVLVRRTPTLVKTKKTIEEKALSVTKQKRLSNIETKRGKARYEHRVKSNVVNVLPRNVQNILHERNASKRKKKSIEAPAVVLPAKTFQTTRLLRKWARKEGLMKQLSQRWTARKVPFYARGLRRKKSEPTKPGKQLKTRLVFTAARVQKRKNFLSEKFAGPTNGLFKKHLALVAKKAETKNIQKNFVKRFKPERLLKKRINKVAVRAIARKGVSLWATRRKELWHQLTSRWMKKRRILRRWLKGIKYSFKEKTHWTFEGEHALPEELFKLSRSRLRRLEWKKADGKFEYVGLKKKLTLRPAEKRTAPWLEGLLYSRALYSTRRLAIRRYQLPKDQKSKKWLQKAKKQLFRKPTTHLYIKRRHWPRLRMYNQRLSRSLFNIRNTKAAVKRFQKANRKGRAGYEVFTKGHLDRVDVNLMLMKFAPSTFWAREMAKSGLISINGKPVVSHNVRFTPGDQISWDHGLLKIYRRYFESHLNKWEKYKQLSSSSRQFPKNMLYQPKLGALTYARYPKADDLDPRGRTNRILFSWFRLDSRLGK